jgi:3'-phosphoadenosine 5'-phosphosulfate (PAPS) 3'-phosphatase
MEAMRVARKELISTVKMNNWGTSSEISVEAPFNSFDAKDAVVWIDPLDATKSFVDGEIQFSTVIIGISIKQESRIGIVHYPFFDVNNDKSKLESRTYFGTVEHGMYMLGPYLSCKTDEFLKRKA